MIMVISFAYCLLAIGTYVYVDQIIDDYERRTERVLFNYAQKFQLFFICICMWWILLVMMLWFELGDEESK